MTTVLQSSPSNTTHEVEVTARAVAGLTQRPDELSPIAQVQYSRSVQQNENIKPRLLMLESVGDNILFMNIIQHPLLYCPFQQIKNTSCFQ